jgi:signal transduction histidine kinase
MADWRKISQALSNLLVNAVKFTMPGGSIRVTVMPQDEHMCLRVSDNGIGIPGESMPHLFEKFHRAHASGTADERGSGLGLAIVHQIVELHGGTITAQSEVGCGSVFTIHLPVAITDAAAPRLALDPAF